MKLVNDLFMKLNQREKITAQGLSFARSGRVSSMSVQSDAQQ